MSAPVILIIGKNGQVGWELSRTLAPLGRLVRVDYPEIDLTSGDSIRKWVRETAPAVVVNAAAYTAVDKAESEPERCRQRIALRSDAFDRQVIGIEDKLIPFDLSGTIAVRRVRRGSPRLVQDGHHDRT